jgi:transcription antitermination factor NusG
MKINRLDAHDRLQYFQKQTETIYQGCMECIRNLPDSIKSSFYVYAHPRTIDLDEQANLITSNVWTDISTLPNKKLIWMPRISKPKPQTNSYLFLTKKSTDLIKIIWMIPPREIWNEYAPDKMTYNEEVWTSIQNFNHCRKVLSSPDEDGPTRRDEEDFRRIIAFEAKKRKREKETEKARQVSSEGFLSLLV